MLTLRQRLYEAVNEWANADDPEISDDESVDMVLDALEEAVVAWLHDGATSLGEGH